MILTPAQRRAMERAVATSNEVLLRLDALAALAEVDPGIKQRHEELRNQRDYLYRLASTALHVDRESDRAK